MGFLDECKQNTRPKQQPIMESLIADWAPEEKEEFFAALEDQTISTSAIIKVLKRRGITVSYNAIHKHRRERV